LYWYKKEVERVLIGAKDLTAASAVSFCLIEIIRDDSTRCSQLIVKSSFQNSHLMKPSGYHSDELTRQSPFFDGLTLPFYLTIDEFTNLTTYPNVRLMLTEDASRRVHDLAKGEGVIHHPDLTGRSGLLFQIPNFIILLSYRL
jgi:hypothetical protein